MSFLLRGLAAGGGLRIIAADTTALVAEAARRHQTSPTASAALGRTLTGALTLAHVLLKNPPDRITLRLRGDGPLGGVIADAGLDGTVRGYVTNPEVYLPPRSDGKLDVGGALGYGGDLQVIRAHAPYGDPYSSSVPLASGEIAEDIAVFLAKSEQIASAVLLGVYLEEERVTRAGGVLLQALPSCDDAALALLEANVRAFRPLTDAMARHSLLEILEELCWGLEFTPLETALPLSFHCRCSVQKALTAVAYFSPAEREAMIAEDGGAEAVCHWCGEKRWLTPEQLRSISREEIRCPDCSTLWYRQGQLTIIREQELCACGRAVKLPN
jgi:molecular chaperone Hsp33